MGKLARIRILWRIHPLRKSPITPTQTLSASLRGAIADISLIMVTIISNAFPHLLESGLREFFSLAVTVMETDLRQRERQRKGKKEDLLLLLLLLDPSVAIARVTLWQTRLVD